MIEGQTAAIIAGASAIGGGMIVAVSNYAINRAQARDSRKAELRKALIDLWDAVAQVDHRLRIEPEPKKTSVNGHRFLPSGGHPTSPLTATTPPHRWPRFLPA